MQDIVFLIGIFLFSALLILGLFPRTDTEERIGRAFFLYLMMITPILAAIYFIVMSFRRKLYSSSSYIGSSIRLKIALAFVFFACFTSLPIIFITNYIIDNQISELITEKTINALEDAINMFDDSINERYDNLYSDLIFLDYSIMTGHFNVNSPKGRRDIDNIFRVKGYNSIVYRVIKKDVSNNDIYEVDRSGYNDTYKNGIKRFFSAIIPKQKYDVYKISIDGISILLGGLNSGNYIIALYKMIPEKILNRVSVYEDALHKYNRKEFSKTYLQTRIRIFLLILSLLIIIVTIIISFILSKNITRPVLELAGAAGSVASGDFSIRLKRDSDDELALLFDSFNKMVKQLDESKEVMYQTQKLQAWKEVAKRLVHEIKNPLTPIRLSAERMQRRFKDKHPDIDNIIITGTETITEEVNVLTRLLNEFSRFARLPEMNPEFQNLNPILENSVNFFRAHEGITFKTDFDDSIPGMYLDKVMIRQALTNVLQNSVDAVKESGNIYVKSELVNNGNDSIVRISIKDEGIGIREEDFKNIFEPTFSTKESGTGLGLTIVEKIVLEHYGRIYFNSIFGEGTEFIIDLPVLKEEEVNSGKDIIS
ncbi:MAG: ATP-binding protein [Spirochaetota bacterium]|nr:ATP-binding protein [Spirochaetota bacterium]